MVRLLQQTYERVDLAARQTISNFRPLASSIESVYLVEASPSLRDAQKQLLCGGAPLKKIDIGFQSISKYSQLPITWCEDIRLVPNGMSNNAFRKSLSP